MMSATNTLAYSPATAAKVAEVSRPTIYRWMRLPGFPVAHIGGLARIPALVKSAGGGERGCIKTRKPLPVFQHRQGQREKVCRPHFPYQILSHAAKEIH